MAEVGALMPEFRRIQSAISELLTATEQQSSGSPRTGTAKRVGENSGRPEVKIAKPVAASGGGSKLLSPGLLEGGGGLSGQNPTTRGSPAGGMTSNPGSSRSMVR